MGHATKQPKTHLSAESPAIRINGLSIHQIYSRFSVPQSLQMHMMRVASVGGIICDNWRGPKINRDLIVSTLLIHDLANIVKFDFKASNKAALAPKDFDGTRQWKQVQAETIKRYGPDDHIATLRMAAEIGAPVEMINLLNEMGKSEDGIHNPAGSGNWALEICLVSDMRVALNGIVPMLIRLDELVKRYHGTPKGLKFIELAKIAPPVEIEVMRNTSIDASDINDKSAKRYIEGFLRA
jgi:hypothetical protein